MMTSWGQWWSYSCGSARAVVDNPEAPLPTFQVYGPVLAADEVGLVSGRAVYSRFYGGDGRYEQSGSFAFGRPAVMVSAVVASAALNAHGKAKARAGAIPSWLNEQPCTVVAANHRLLCNTATNGWLSFFYDDVSSFQPDLASWTLMLTFHEQCSPLRISGPPAPALALWAGIGIEGPRWSSDPRLMPLLATR